MSKKHKQNGKEGRTRIVIMKGKKHVAKVKENVRMG